MKDYGQGRKDVLFELTNYLDKEIVNVIKAKIICDNGYKNAHLSGVLKTLNKTNLVVMTKLDKTIKRDRNNVEIIN